MRLYREPTRSTTRPPSSKTPLSRNPSSKNCVAANRDQLRKRRPLVGLAGALWLTIAALPSCGSTTPAQAPEAAFENPLSTLEGVHKPPLTLIAREGDSYPAAAIAISHGVPPAQIRQLAAKMRAQLRAHGLHAKPRLYQQGLVLSAPVLGDVSAAFEAFRAAVRSTASTRRPKPVETATDPCALERDYVQAPLKLGYRNTALAAVGPDDFTDEWRSLHEAAPAWPEGDAAYDPWPKHDVFVEARGHAEELWIALRTSSSDKLQGALTELQGRHSLLRAWAASAPPGWEVAEPHASKRPAGGCLAVRLEPRSAPSTAQAATVAAAAAALMRDALDKAPPRPFEEAALTAESPEEAAARSAWFGLANSGGNQSPSAAPMRELVHWQSQRAKQEPSFEDAYEQALNRTTLDVNAEVETGRGQLWLALHSDCPLVHETEQTAGHTALALKAVSEQSPNLEFRTGPLGPMLLAHGPALQPGDGFELVKATAHALASALKEPRSTAEDVQVVLHSPPMPLLELGAQLVTEGHPGDLLQLGTKSSQLGANSLALRRALLRFLQGPLRLSVIGNIDKNQVEQLHAQSELLLSPFRVALKRCPKPKLENLAGEYALDTDDPEADALLLIPFPSDDLAHAEALAAMASRPGGWLEKAIVAPGLADRAEVVALGHRGGAAALAFALRKQDGPATQATAQLRALLRRVGKGKFTKTDLTFLARYSEHHRPHTMQQRLLDLAGGRGEVPPASELIRFAQAYIHEKRAVLVTASAPE